MEENFQSLLSVNNYFCKFATYCKYDYIFITCMHISVSIIKDSIQSISMEWKLCLDC